MATKTKPRRRTFTKASQIKTYVRKNGYFAGNDLSDVISERIESLLITAFFRAKSNGRRTVRGCDI